jgi:[ribosomal protein S18]-alanine N-acetyltransferase
VLLFTAMSLVSQSAQVSPNAEIRPAGLSDLLAFSSLEQACFGPDAWGLFDLFMALTGSAVRLKAVIGSRVVGIVVGDPHPREGYSWIATIGVHPDFQRQGIGARLLAAAEASLSTPIIKLTVRQSNLGAIALYEKFGYQHVEVWQRYYSSGEPGVVMRKIRRL